MVLNLFDAHHFSQVLSWNFLFGNQELQDQWMSPKQNQFSLSRIRMSETCMASYAIEQWNLWLL